MIVLLLLWLNPQIEPVTDHVDRIEVNAVFDREGKLIFDQVIFSDLNHRTGEFDVVAWRILKGVRSESKDDCARWAEKHPGERYVPTWIGGHAEPRHVAGQWASEWFDEKDRVHRRVRATGYVITSSNYDREMIQREVLPECERRGLRKRR